MPTVRRFSFISKPEMRITGMILSFASHLLRGFIPDCLPKNAKALSNTLARSPTFFHLNGERDSTRFA